MERLYNSNLPFFFSVHFKIQYQQVSRLGILMFWKNKYFLNTFKFTFFSCYWFLILAFIERFQYLAKIWFFWEMGVCTFTSVRRPPTSPGFFCSRIIMDIFETSQEKLNLKTTNWESSNKLLRTAKHGELEKYFTKWHYLFYWQIIKAFMKLKLHVHVQIIFLASTTVVICLQWQETLIITWMVLIRRTPGLD